MEFQVPREANVIGVRSAAEEERTDGRTWLSP